MTYHELLILCQSRNCEELKIFLSSDVMDLSAKIIASAVIQTYHPDSAVRDAYGLARCWNDKLSDEHEPYCHVDLDSFYRAYRAVKVDLKDDLVASAIVTYVQKNKVKLAGILNRPVIADEYKAVLIKTFGDLTVTETERKNESNRKLMAQIHYEILHEIDRRKLKKERETGQIIQSIIEQLLGLKKDTTYVYPSAHFSPNTFVGIFASLAKKMGRYIDKIPVVRLESYAEMLKNLGLKVKGTTVLVYERATVIEITKTPTETLNKLIEIVNKLDNETPERNSVLLSNSWLFSEKSRHAQDENLNKIPTLSNVN